MASLTFNVMPALAAACLGYRFTAHEQDCIAHFSACAAYRQGVPADLLTVTLGQQRAFLYFMLRTARGNVDPQSTRTVMQPLVTMNFPRLPVPIQPVARSILHGYGRLFFGDELCDRSAAMFRSGHYFKILNKAQISSYTTAFQTAVGL